LADKDLTFSIFGRDVNASKVLRQVGGAVGSLDEKLDGLGKTSLKSLAGLEAAAVGAGVGVAGGVLVATGAIVAAGVALAGNSAEVGAAWGNVVEEFKSGAEEAAAPMRGPLLNSIKTLHGTTRALQPQLRDAFTAGIPALEALTRGADGFARSAMPGVVKAVRSSEPVFRGFESFLVDTGLGFNDFFTGLSTGASSSGQILAEVGGIVRDTLGTVGPLLANLANEGAPSVEQLRIVLGNLFDVITALTTGGFPVMFTAANAALQVLGGLLAVVEPIASELGTLIGVLISLAAAFKLLSTIGGGMQAIGAGLTGFVSQVRDAGNNAEAGKGKFSALTAFMGGPWGIAFGVAGVALAIFGAKSAEAEQRQQDLANALRQSKGAIDDNVRSVALKNLQDVGALDKAKQLGISTRDLTDAYLGQGDAANDLKARLNGMIDAMDREGVPLQENAADTKRLVDEMMKRATTGRDLISVLDDSSDPNRKAVEDARLLADAMGAASRATDDMTLAGRTNEHAVGELRAAYMTLQDSVGDTNARLDALEKIMNRLSGQNETYEEAVQSLNDTVRGIGDTFGGNADQAKGWGDALLDASGKVITTSENGSKLRDTMKDLQRNTLAVADAMARNGASQQEVAAFVSATRDRFLEQRDALGLTESGANRLLDAYGLLPGEVSTVILTPNLGDRMAAVDAFRAKITTLPNGHVIIHADTVNAQGSIDRMVQANDGRIVRINIQTNGTIQPKDQYGRPVGMSYVASGGPVEAGKPYMVGERGPELVFPAESGWVANARDTAEIMRGGRLDNVHGVGSPGSMVYGGAVPEVRVTFDWGSGSGLTGADRLLWEWIKSTARTRGEVVFR